MSKFFTIHLENDYHTYEGYECENCSTNYIGDYEMLLREVQGEIRRNYIKYWNEYFNKIKKLTKGKINEYRLP